MFLNKSYLDYYLLLYILILYENYLIKILF